MGQVLQYLESFADDVMGFLPFNVDDKTDPTRILLVPRIVQSLLTGKPGNAHLSISFKE